jgi:hypothetical protein
MRTVDSKWKPLMLLLTAWVTAAFAVSARATAADAPRPN